jgi:PAS domain S-box-containing protein
MTVGKTHGDQEPECGQAERPSILGGLAQRLQEGVRATIVALGQSHAQRLAALVESSDDAILSLDLDTTIATWNRGAEQLFGYEAEEIIGKSVAILIPADRQGEEPNILERIARSEHVHHYETIRLRKDGRPVPVSLSVSPIVDPAGTVIGASKIARDITERKRAEDSLAKHAGEQAALYQFTDRLFRAVSVEDLYEAALDAIVHALGCDRAAILMFDHIGVMKFVAWRGLSDAYRRAVEGHSPWTREAKDLQPISIANIDDADIDASLKAAVKAEGIAALAFIPLVGKGELVGKFMAYYPAPHVFSPTDIELALTIARQLGFSVERMRAEEAKQLLLKESQHRIKNTLATVQAIAGQTLRRTEPGELQAFMARLQALAEAQDLLTTESWHQAPLREVVGRALKPFDPTRHDRIIADGPNVAVPAKSSLMLTMCLHELATNAAKYGALSNGTGEVRIGWELLGNGANKDRKLKLSWRETGGPPVAAPPRKGFGSLLIEQGFAGHGETCVDFRPDGLRWSLELSLD